MKDILQNILLKMEMLEFDIAFKIYYTFLMSWHLLFKCSSLLIENCVCTANSSPPANPWWVLAGQHCTCHRHVHTWSCQVRTRC